MCFDEAKKLCQKLSINHNERHYVIYGHKHISYDVASETMYDLIMEQNTNIWCAGFSNMGTWVDSF